MKFDLCKVIETLSQFLEIFNILASPYCLHWRSLRGRLRLIATYLSINDHLERADARPYFIGNG